ncbi:unnamed protein product [Rotaria sp. Silwood2]|nr:unnamed protein product [Rotaria sp. Silwood2]CAF4474549.1 unnamed protein product [Rotaria sp. Silwood2]
MFFILCLLLITIVLIYFKLKYFTLYGSIPGTLLQFLFGNIVQTGFTHGELFGNIALQYQAKYGDTFQFWFGPLHLIFVCNPEDVQHVFAYQQIYDPGDLNANRHGLFFHHGLVCNRGPKYKRHAAIVLPLFRRNRILNNLDFIINCTDKLLEQWRSKTDNDPNYIHLDTVNQCQNVILGIFGFTGFDYDLKTLDESNINNKNQLTMAIYHFMGVFVKSFQMPHIATKIYLKFSFQYRHAMVTISKYLNQMIEQEQRKTLEEIAQRKRISSIASLIGSLQQDEKHEATKPEEEKKGLSRTEIFHEMLLFLVAGSESTGSVLAWFIYLMSKYPRVQKRFQNEDKDHYPYASIPFGSGHRQCIGQDLARFELKAIAVRLMQYVTFGDGGSQVNSGGYIQGLTLIPKNVGVTITFD